MITDSRYPTEPREFYGKSGEVKPTEFFKGLPVTNGSFFFEIDTGNVFVYDADSYSWNAV